MSSTTLQAVGTSLLAWLLLKIAQKLTTRNPLDNVPGPASASWLTGSILDLVDPQAWDYQTQLVKKYGSVIKIHGLLSDPFLYVFDPKALQSIFSKDQHVYDELDSFLAINNVCFGKGLLATQGEQHRKQRKMLNPVFSPTHMKLMVPVFYEVAQRLRDTLEAKVKSGPQEVDAFRWATRVALELIGQSGLGYSFDPLTEDAEEHPYSFSVRNLTEALGKLFMWHYYFLPIVQDWGTPKFRRLTVDFFSFFWGTLRSARDIIDVMTQTSIGIYESKKRALSEGDEAVHQQIGKGNDIISILMRANLEASDQDKFSEDEVIAQMSTFTFAAMDTTSTAVSHTLEYLSQQPEIQQRLREEIRRAGPGIGYDHLMNLPLLDAICKETLRLNPPLTMLVREAKQDGILPLSKPIIGNNGKEMHEIAIPKGTTLFVSNFSSNRNVELWGPDAHEWKPERWLVPLPDDLVEAKIPGVFSHLMTFFAGPRACIGFKFAELEMKVVLFVLLETLSFSPSSHKIVWHMRGISQPHVDQDGVDTIQLPVMVDLA